MPLKDHRGNWLHILFLPGPEPGSSTWRANALITRLPRHPNNIVTFTTYKFYTLSMLCPWSISKAVYTNVIRPYSNNLLVLWQVTINYQDIWTVEFILQRNKSMCEKSYAVVPSMCIQVNDITIWLWTRMLNTKAKYMLKPVLHDIFRRFNSKFLLSPIDFN